MASNTAAGMLSDVTRQAGAGNVGCFAGRLLLHALRASAADVDLLCLLLPLTVHLAALYSRPGVFNEGGFISCVLSALLLLPLFPVSTASAAASIPC